MGGGIPSINQEIIPDYIGIKPIINENVGKGFVECQNSMWYNVQVVSTISNRFDNEDQHGHS